jgi:hypothetical protein
MYTRHACPFAVSHRPAQISAPTLARAIEPYLHPELPKIKILERAPGAKTTVAKRLIAAGVHDELADLADPDTLALARDDIKQFLTALSERAIVDEVHPLVRLSFAARRASA